ncbi:hypothetical protein M3Y94_01084800 [Aphelenchoides besseyi]|nr:hypothetical protein M3Y94_01084800 [Aphelenchoides besseyi]
MQIRRLRHISNLQLFFFVALQSGWLMEKASASLIIADDIFASSTLLIDVSGLSMIPLLFVVILCTLCNFFFVVDRAPLAAPSSEGLDVLIPGMCGLFQWLCCVVCCGRDPVGKAKHTSMLDADQRRKQFAFQNARSHSAPPRKKVWYRRGLLRRQGSHSMLYDKMVSRRLVGAIAVWHDLHSQLLALDRPTAKTDEQSTSSTPSTSPADCDESAASTPPTDNESDHEWAHSAPVTGRIDYEDDSSQDESILLSDDELDEIVDFERRNLNTRFSISNPELANGQIKQMFPELSDHWRLV